MNEGGQQQWARKNNLLWKDKVLNSKTDGRKRKKGESFREDKIYDSFGRVFACKKGIKSLFFADKPNDWYYYLVSSSEKYYITEVATYVIRALKRKQSVSSKNVGPKFGVFYWS